MNVDNVIAELELERKIVAQRLQDLDDVIASLSRIRSGHRADAPVALAERKARQPIDYARARQMYENGGATISRIAAALKCHETAIYARKKKESWKRRQQQEPRKAPAA